MRDQIIFGTLLSLTCFNAFATEKVPTCMKFGDVVTANNSKILSLKESGPDTKSSGALVSGRIVKNYPKSADCPHCPRFQLKIGNRPTDTVEVYYSGEDKMKTRAGDKVTVCGLYVRNVNGWYENPKSPDGGYISDTSLSNALPWHEDGFLILNSHLYEN